jgi:hypothetical protein
MMSVGQVSEGKPALLFYEPSGGAEADCGIVMSREWQRRDSLMTHDCDY